MGFCSLLFKLVEIDCISSVDWSVVAIVLIPMLAVNLYLQCVVHVLTAPIKKKGNTNFILYEYFKLHADNTV